MMLPVLSICVGHRGRSPCIANGVALPIFPKCVAALSSAVADLGEPCELVVADWPLPDCPPVKDWLVAACPPSLLVRVVEPARPWTRGTGRNAAAAVASAEWLFFLDADMLTPAAVLQRGLAVLGMGLAYFPLYRRYSGADEKGLAWGSGEGNSFVTRTDWLAAGRFQETTEYGSEDTAFGHWFRARGRYVRDEQPDFRHQWHPRPGQGG